VKGIAGSGKTELLLQIALTSILPASRDGLIFNGNESVVVFFSNDQKFCLSRIVHLFYQRIISAASVASKSSSITSSSGDPEASSATTDSLLQECLSRLWIMRCQDWLQFKASMVALPRRLAAINKQAAITPNATEPLPNQPPGADTPVTVIIDSMDTFFLLEGKQSSQHDSTEDLVRNFLYTNSQSMVFASVSEMNSIANSINSTVLTLNSGTADCTGSSRPYRIDDNLGFTLS
jgi:hypothetical protein